ncbi:MAG: HD domain-containing protein [bacterium]|nr:HD domain-containing protein [bacterium]
MKNIIEKIKKDNLLTQIVNNLPPTGNFYLVGGAIRDFYFDKENYDKDIITENIDADFFSKDLAQKLNATFVPLDETNKIYRLVLKDKINYIDIAQCEGKDIIEDLKRRDITINSIAVNLKTLEILDINNGLKDLEKKEIKTISEKNIIDDPLRILRIFRFCASLGFEIEQNTKDLAKKHFNLITNCSQERINYELLKLFNGQNASIAIKQMDKIGLVDILFPIMKEVRKIPPNSHHHLPLIGHLIETVNQLELLYKKAPKEIKEHFDLIDFGGNTRLSHLKLSGFLHDIGKPSTWTIEEDTGRHRFIKHDEIGSRMSKTILKEMKFSKKQIAYISAMIKHHIHPAQIVESKDTTEKTFMRFIRKMENNLIDVIYLAMADRLSARGEAITDEMVNTNLKNLQNLLNLYLAKKDTLKPLPKLIDGEEIMQKFNLSPSPKLGQIINELKEEQLCGNILTKNDAINFIKTKI